jgi:hypothetical protein
MGQIKKTPGADGDPRAAQHIAERQPTLVRVPRTQWRHGELDGVCARRAPEHEDRVTEGDERRGPLDSSAFSRRRVGESE